MTEQGTSPTGAGRKRVRGFAILGVLVAAGLAAGTLYRNYSRTHLSTDDAFVEGAVHLVSPRIAGTVTAVYVANNQLVKEGDPIVDIEPALLDRKLAEAKASLEAERARIAELSALVEAEKTKIAAAEAALDKAVAMREQLKAQAAARGAEVQARKAAADQAEKDLERAGTLMEREVIPRSRYDSAVTARDTALASLSAAREMKREADLALTSHESSILEARAALKSREAGLLQSKAALETQRKQVQIREAQESTAELNLSWTRVAAPADGWVTRKAVETGNHVQAGQPLMSVVSLDDAYVAANYKETDLHLIRPGQRVEMEFDAYPGRTFSGRVDSIMAGTGSAFSLFPPENASGNYVKVVQRVPVKIVFDDLEEAKPYLRVGMSVVPVVFTGD